MKKLSIHILDNKILYFCQNELNIITTSLSYGKIDKENLFLSDLKKQNKKYLLNRHFIGDEITIIINDLYTEQDIKYLKQLFIELQFTKITILKESSFFKNEKSIFIIIDEELVRIIIPNNKPLIMSTPLFIPNIVDQLMHNFQHINSIKVLNYTSSNQLLDYSKVYTYTNPNFFFFKKITKIPPTIEN